MVGKMLTTFSILEEQEKIKSRYPGIFTCDITIGGFTIPEVGILVKTDRQLTSSKGVKTRLPVIVGCNLFKLATRRFIRDYGEEALKLFECPKGIDPLFFSCVLVFYYGELARESNSLGESGRRGQWQARGGGSPCDELPVRERRRSH